MNEKIIIAPGTFLTEGKKIYDESRLKIDCIIVFIDPLESNSPVNAYAIIYGGIDKGKISDHLKKPFPLKSQAVTSHAVETPKIKTPNETPQTKSKELEIYSTSTVCIRCSHVAEYPSKRLANMRKIGTRKIIEITEKKNLVRFE